MSTRAKATLVSLLHLVAAAAIYWFLCKGGWLTAHYDLGSANNVNLLLALFEPIAVVCVAAYWLRRTRFRYKLICALAGVQLLIGIGAVAFLLFFALTYHPRLM